MTAPQIVARYDGAIVALTTTGELFAHTRGGWEPIPGPEDGGRIVSIAVRPNGGLIAVMAAGRIYEQYRAGVHLGDHSQAWRPVPALPTGQEQPHTRL
jgi:hypothetical protein